MFEIPDFTVVNGLISLLAAYYTYDISYPKAFAASNVFTRVHPRKQEQESETCCEIQ